MSISEHYIAPAVDTAVQLRNGGAAQAVGAALGVYNAPLSMSTIEGVTKVALCIYALGQVAYLAWRWYTAYKDRKEGRNVKE